MRGARLFLEAAHRHGITRAFGIVGGEARAIRFDEVPGLSFYLTRHEFAAGIMADVCGRLEGVPQMCYSTFGPGVTNLATGICSAALDRSPMLAVSAQVMRSERVYNWTHQCIDNVAVMGPMCKYARELDSVDEIPEIVTAALRAARTEPPGPASSAFLSISCWPRSTTAWRVGSSNPWEAPNRRRHRRRGGRIWSGSWRSSERHGDRSRWAETS